MEESSETAQIVFNVFPKCKKCDSDLVPVSDVRSGVSMPFARWHCPNCNESHPPVTPASMGVF